MDRFNSYSRQAAGSNTHLRDQQHALRFYSESSHLFTPKVKFLYHATFQVNDQADAPNTKKFREELSVLAANVALPKFTASVDTKQQYNRKKHYQTRIDYSEVSFSFYDDNLGASRKLLEEYYRHYSSDGNTAVTTENKFNTRDKYFTDGSLPAYGLDTGVTYPFFDYITVYQLSQGEWASYRLVNPILTAWGHDSMDYSDGGTSMMNDISIAYESVIYDHGELAENGEPQGFASAASRYDITPSPYGKVDTSSAGDIHKIVSNRPRLISRDTQRKISPLLRAFNSDQDRPTATTDIQNLPGGLGSTSIPNPNTRSNRTQSGRITPPAARSRDTSRLGNSIANIPGGQDSLVARSINAGSIPGVNYNAYNALPTAEANAIKNEVLNRLDNGDSKEVNIANDIINNTGTLT